jgi:hypothetical protein
MKADAKLQLFFHIAEFIFPPAPKPASFPTPLHGSVLPPFNPGSFPHRYSNVTAYHDG